METTITGKSKEAKTDLLRDDMGKDLLAD